MELNTFGDDATTGVDAEVCAAEVYRAQVRPLDIVGLLDQSGSMLDPAGNSKWQQVTSALEAFVADPASQGIGLGLQYFGLTLPKTATSLPCSGNASCPAPVTTCSGGYCLTLQTSCDATDYAALEVPITPIPQVSSALATSIAAQTPSGGTPTAPALAGAISTAQGWSRSHPGHAVVVVMLTDGLPENCSPMDIPTIASQIVAPAESASPPILTFVIGVGGDLQDLDGIAAAGGTGTRAQVLARHPGTALRQGARTAPRTHYRAAAARD